MKNKNKWPLFAKYLLGGLKLPEEVLILPEKAMAIVLFQWFF
jgi:hypothetical protein